MLISVIIPCYNSIMFIRNLFEDFEKQTIGFQNLELIFVNDNSTDGTIAVLQEFQKMHPNNVIVINNQENQGVSHSRNSGVQRATSDYVTFVDHDDILENDLYEKLYDRMQQYHCEVVMCAHDLMCEKLPINKKKKVTEQMIYLGTAEQRKQFMLTFRGEPECWSKLIRKDFLTQNEITFPEGMWGEDFYWWSLVEMHLGSFCWIPEVLYHHVQTTKIYRKDMQNWMSAQCLLREEAEKRNLYVNYWDILDFDLFELGFASTLFYWIQCGVSQVEEFEYLRQVTNSLIHEVGQNPLLSTQEHFRYRYSKHALNLLRSAITQERIIEFLHEIKNELSPKCDSNN